MLRCAETIFGEFLRFSLDFIFRVAAPLPTWVRFTAPHADAGIDVVRFAPSATPCANDETDDVGRPGCAPNAEAFTDRRRRHSEPRPTSFGASLQSSGSFPQVMKLSGVR